MRIGLFPSEEYSVKNGVDSIELIHENAFKTEVFKIGKSINGSKHELRVDGATVLLRKLSFGNFSDVQYESSCSCFGIHFLLEGNYEFTGLENKAKVNIDSGFYNIIQWPNILGTQKFKGLDYISVEIFFIKEFLEDLLGTEHITFKDFLNSSGKYPRSLWEKGQPIPERLRVLLLEILNCPYTGKAKTNYIESQMRCLVIEAFLKKENCIDEIKKAQLPAMDYEAIEKVVSHIQQNLKLKLTIKELSEVAGFNTTKLKNCFKKVHQTTIFKFITQLRMEKAKLLILEQNFTIAQASYEVGYSNPQHFTVAFKKSMGYLPSKLLGTTL
ncbi:helix-turn-helix domain-containing protein [Zobellia nedashkovskayae]|uniref:helix-turn-helix domain-containing protein n=1 Tax=Zobellia nedashkovskayae TaxID=2779510 RepID=UPI00188CB3CB|nr:AraC family transcriptional regulator [Zobellia nedashkovskayae]